MERGYISGYQITWRRKAEERYVASFPGYKWHRTKCYVAYKCRKCNYILFENDPLRFGRKETISPTLDMSYIKRKMKNGNL